ncbi:MAG: efflux RND transporter periplasmic adaptor subunit [Calditrichia bacterium]
MKKKFFIGIGVLVALFFLWRIYALLSPGGEKGKGKFARPPVAVEVDSVRYGPIRDIKQFTGTVFPEYQYVVAPKVTGRIIEIRKRIGDWVNSGEIIARIDDAEYQQAVREAEANLKIARASLTESLSQFELAGQEKERVESLQAKGIASPSELDAAVSNYTAQESRYHLAKAQVEQREASLKSARIRLGYTVLTASKAGFIGERFVDEGALLAPNAAVVTVLGIDSVLVRTTIIERDYGSIQKGQMATVNVDAFPDQRFSGSVLRIAPMLQEASRVAQMEVGIANKSRQLKPGMFARVEVVTSERDSAQIVPSKAVITREGETGIFIVRQGENVARYFPVKPGITTADFTEITSPILQGRVITLGQHLLEEGSPLLLPKAGSGKSTESAAEAGKRGRP